MSTPSFEDMETEIINWFDLATSFEQERFLQTKKEDLILYHHSLGRKIRNDFNLWENLDEHPDILSMRLIESVWSKMQNKEM